MRDVVEKAKAAGRTVQSAAFDFANTSAETLKGQASQVMDAAKDVAATAQDRLQDKIFEQKGIGADYVGNFADTMRRAASQFDVDAPAAGTYIRKAAAQVESAADALRNGELGDLIQGAQKFARSQPTVFFGLTLLAGFGVIRFLKSASEASDRESDAGAYPNAPRERGSATSSSYDGRAM